MGPCPLDVNCGGLAIFVEDSPKPVEDHRAQRAEGRDPQTRQPDHALKGLRRIIKI